MQHTVQLGCRRAHAQPSVPLTMRMPNYDAAALERIFERVGQLLPTLVSDDDVLVSEPDLDAGFKSAVTLRLAIARELLQACKVPVFDLGEVSDLQPTDEPSCSLTCHVPWVDDFPLSVCLKAHEWAGQVLQVMAMAQDAVVVTQLFEQIYAQFIERARRQIPGGVAAIPVLANCHHRQQPFRHVGLGIYQVGWGAKRRLFDRSSGDQDSNIGARLASSKSGTTRLLLAAGLPTSNQEVVRTAAEAKRAASKLNWPVVVKPDAGERGEGVVTNIRDEATLLAAFEAARQHGAKVVVEQHVRGLCHRILVSAGQLIYASQRLPKLVVGDGKRCVKQLIDDGNATERDKLPWRRLKPLPNDAITQQTLTDQGLQLSSTPEAGRQVFLRSRDDTATGGQAVDMTATIHPANASAAIRAVALLGLSTGGVDFISEDITKPWWDNGAMINEVNFAPNVGEHRTGISVEGVLGGWTDVLLPDDGRIDIELLLGPDAIDRGMTVLRDEQKQQKAVFLLHETNCWGPNGEIDRLGVSGLAPGLRALTARPEVEKILIALDDPEQAFNRLPIDRIHRYSESSAALGVEWALLKASVKRFMVRSVSTRSLTNAKTKNPAR